MANLSAQAICISRGRREPPGGPLLLFLATKNLEPSCSHQLVRGVICSSFQSAYDPELLVEDGDSAVEGRLGCWLAVEIFITSVPLGIVDNGALADAYPKKLDNLGTRAPAV